MEDGEDSTNGHGIHSDGDEDDIEDDDDNSPRGFGNGRESLESNSEQSMTSPAGFGSLPSLGSPASLASPSTPQAFELANSGPSNGNSDWLRPSAPSASVGMGAFRPPVINPTSSASSSTSGSTSESSLYHQFHAGPFYPYNGLMQHNMQNAHREPVGTDPRDSKNPLSISQLTGTKKVAAALGGASSLLAPSSSNGPGTGPSSLFGNLSGQNCSSSTTSSSHPTPGGSEKRTLLGMT